MFGDKLKKIISKEGEDEKEGNNKKKIENLVAFLVILIITVVAINIIWNGNKKDKNQQNNNTSTKQLATDNINLTNTNQNNTQNTSDTYNLEENLKLILSKIKGVGEVEIFINYSESNEVIPMYNENSQVSNTEETDTSGGTRKIQQTDSQKEIIYQEQDGEKIPITQKVVQPKVEGAIITAKGAGDATIKTNIIQAVEAVTGLATHKIQVFEMN